MPKLYGVQLPDQFVNEYKTADINKRVAMWRFINRPDLADRAVDEWAKENYGHYGLAFNDPEIKKILRQAATEGWSDQRILGALQKTKYWKTHTEAQRRWDTLNSTDKATAKQLVKDTQGNVEAIASRMGVTLGSKSKKLAEHIAKNGITDPQEIQRLIAAEARMGGGNLGPGDITANVSAIKARASDYGVLLTDQGAFDWAQRLAAGTATQDGVNEYLMQQAKARFSSNKMIQDALARGQTVRDALDPQIAQIAELLEIDPDTIRLTDPRWSSVMEKQQDDGTFNVMTSADAAAYARGLPEWNKTRNAHESAASFGEALLQRFGAVA